MKKILSIITLSFAAVTLFAQSPANRTPKTIVADVLAQMPAKNITVYNKMMADLVSAGEEGIIELTDMIAAPGKGDNTLVSFATGGLAYYVSQEGTKADCEMVSKAFIKALDKSNDRETKAFLIRMLQITGRDDVISTMEKYALSKDLYVEAIKALAYINTPKSIATIVSLEPKISDKKVIAQAAGERSLTELEPKLIEWYNTDDAALKKAVTHALSKMQGVNAINTLASSAEKLAYTYEEMETTGAMLYNAANSQTTDVSKKLIKKWSASSNSAPVRSQAMALTLEANPTKSTKYVVAAMEDGDRRYRNSILALCELYNTDEVAAQLISKFASYDDATKTDVVIWFTEKGITSALTTVATCLTASDKDLRENAMRYMVIKNSEQSISAMMSVLSSDDKEVIESLKAAMLWSKYQNFNQANLDAVKAGSRTAKVGVLEFLAERKMPDMTPFIEEYRTGSDKELQTLAYKAMVTCSTPADLNKLFTVLVSVDSENAGYVQKAIGNQLITMAPQRALDQIGRNSNKVAKDRLYPLYAYVPTKESIATLKSLYQTESGSAKKAAASALVAWSNTDALDEVYMVASDSEMKSLQSEAIKNSIARMSKSDLTAEQKFLSLRRLMCIATDLQDKKAIMGAIGGCTSFNALMFVAPFMSDASLEQDAATAVYKIALADKTYSFYGSNVETILNKFMAIRTGGDAGYEIQGVKDYIASAPKGEGFVSVFNGKDLTNWKGLVKNPIARAKMSASELAKEQAKADALMVDSWIVKDGELQFTGTGFDNLCSDKKYGDFEMYVDWKIFYADETSKRDGDAGIYLRGTPQVQIWDTSRTNVGAEVGSGGLYNNGKNPRDPMLVADNAVGQWNTFYIKMVGERVTVYLNGKLVVNNVIMDNYWDRSIPIFLEEQIELQAHGSLVAYRDIYIKELERVEPIELSAEEAKEGFELLFDGVSMSNWQGNTKDYIAENGTITLYPKNGGGGNLYSIKEYDNFVLRFEFQLTDAANNGLGIRTPMGVDAAYHGMELQIIDGEHPVYKNIKPHQHHGSVYGIQAGKRGFMKPIGEWNVQEVIADGDMITITLNGEVIQKCNIREASKGGTETLDKQKHPGLLNKSGYIGFLGHGSKVSFRNIRIKEL